MCCTARLPPGGDQAAGASPAAHLWENLNNLRAEHKMWEMYKYKIAHLTMLLSILTNCF